MKLTLSLFLILGAAAQALAGGGGFINPGGGGSASVDGTVISPSSIMDSGQATVVGTTTLKGNLEARGNFAFNGVMSPTGVFGSPSSDTFDIMGKGTGKVRFNRTDGTGGVVFYDGSGITSTIGPNGIVMNGATGHIVGTSSITTTGTVFANTAQLGAGATQSTFSATGALTIAGGTFTTNTAGFISAPGQPYFRSAPTAEVLSGGVLLPIYFQAPAAGANIGGMYGGASSSNTITVPATGGGTYQVLFKQFMPTGASSHIIDIKVNNTIVVECYQFTTAGQNNTLTCSDIIPLAAGDVVTVFLKNGGSTLTEDNVLVNDSFTMAKLW